MESAVRVRGARQHNLKGVDVDIPHRALTVLTGPSGSGKSSLAFDTVYAEGQRRYVESLSTYAKQFLERMPKPEVERIDGVAPSVAIDQRNSVRTSRSTVGTVTEVYDYLRLLYARVGRTICPGCGERVVPDTVQSATDEVLALPEGTRIHVVFPLRLSDELGHAVAVDNLRSQGYVRVVVDDREWHLDDLEPPAAGGGPPEGAPDLAAGQELEVVVDRLTVRDDQRERLADALAAAFAEGHGRAEVLRTGRDAEGVFRAGDRLRFTESFRCASCGREFPEPTPGLFSFNHPAGACPTCNGFGATLEYDRGLIVPDPGRSLADGALDPWTKPRYQRERDRLSEFLARRDADPRRPWRELPPELREELLEGSDDFEGVLPFLRSRERKRYKRYIRVFLRQYQRPRTCRSCAGARLRPEALQVQVGGETIAEATSRTVADFREWLAALALEPFERKVAATVLEEIADRAAFLDRVGLGYLTLDRQARSLSGGEMQRIRLAGSLGSRLVDTLYVLDEPTIGLHPRDVERFLDVLGELRDRGNTVLVVEHETAVLRAADRVVELGPGAGERGGELVFSGSYAELPGAGTATGDALSRPPPAARRTGPPADAGRLRLRGARLHNVRGVDLDVPLRSLTAVTGVSGSGKSTLVHDILYRALERELRGETSARLHLGEAEGSWEALEGVGAIRGVVLVDQSPIGRTSRSNPVTYIKAFGEIRRLFAEQPEARRRGLGPGHFSFNVAGGRCEACKGTGEETVEMVFLADVAVPCEVCGGARYGREVLEVTWRDRNIRDVLDMTVDEAIRFFARQDKLGAALWQLQRVGLGYLRLGQPATTLSGGEAQRLKVARELAGAGAGRRLYILDEPTTGLGAGEVDRLVDVLEQLVDAGNTVLVVEHDLDLIARAHWVVDLGPGAAAEGGRIVAAGTPAEIAGTETHTGVHLRRHLARTSRRGGSGARRRRAGDG